MTATRPKTRAVAAPERRLEQLKAKAYDLIAQREGLQLQHNALTEELGQVNSEIAQLLGHSPVVLDG